MSQHRKIFRFLKFIDEFSKIKSGLTKNSDCPILIRFLSQVSHFSSLFYYIFDNLVWAINAGIIDKFYTKEEIKSLKNTKRWFSFSRLVVTILINTYQLKRIRRIEKDCFRQFKIWTDVVIQP